MMNGWEDTASWCPLLVRHVNVLDKLKEEFRIEIADGVYVDRLVWQIIEYFVEHRDNTENMIDIAAKLGNPAKASFPKKSSCSRNTGLLTVSSRRATKRRSSSGRREKAIRFYRKNSADNVSKEFLPFFEKLERFSDEEIAAFTEALEVLTASCEAKEQQPQRLKYIKLD